MQEVVDQGPHCSALSDKAIAHFNAEVEEMVKIGQAKLVAWDSIKDNPPVELQISPILVIPHKSKQFWSILDLSFHLRLKQGGILPSVNATTVKTTPKSTIDQLDHSIARIIIIHAFVETEDDARIFMAKWDIKDDFGEWMRKRALNGILRMSCPRVPAVQATLWCPPHSRCGGRSHLHFFCVASETAQDVAQDYCETEVGTLPPPTNS